MSGSATPVIAHIVETMRVKIVTSETNVGGLRREKLGSDFRRNEIRAAMAKV